MLKTTRRRTRALSVDASCGVLLSRSYAGEPTAFPVHGIDDGRDSRTRPGLLHEQWSTAIRRVAGMLCAEQWSLQGPYAPDVRGGSPPGMRPSPSDAESGR